MLVVEFHFKRNYPQNFKIVGVKHFNNIKIDEYRPDDLEDTVYKIPRRSFAIPNNHLEDDTLAESVLQRLDINQPVHVDVFKGTLNQFKKMMNKTVRLTAAFLKEVNVEKRLVLNDFHQYFTYSEEELKGYVITKANGQGKTLGQILASPGVQKTYKLYAIRNLKMLMLNLARSGYVCLDVDGANLLYFQKHQHWKSVGVEIEYCLNRQTYKYPEHIAMMQMFIGLVKVYQNPNVRENFSIPKESLEEFNKGFWAVVFLGSRTVTQADKSNLSKLDNFDSLDPMNPDPSLISMAAMSINSDVYKELDRVYTAKHGNPDYFKTYWKLLRVTLMQSRVLFRSDASLKMALTNVPTTNLNTREKLLFDNLRTMVLPRE
jgi:hypothetical protein